MTQKYIIFGILLSLITAISCIAYERAVKDLGAIAPILNGVFMSLIMLITALFIGRDSVKLTSATLKNVYLWIYLASGVTTPLWFYITKRYTVALGATYEISYFVLLIAAYAMFGVQKLTLNFIFGSLLVIAGLIFVTM